MAEAEIPVDLLNPGQVFACLGFLEAAEGLMGGASAGFEWSATAARFQVEADGAHHPVAHVLEFLANATARRRGPAGYADAEREALARKREESRKKALLKAQKKSESAPSPKRSKRPAAQEAGSDSIEHEDGPLDVIDDDMSPSSELDAATLPIRLEHEGRCLDLAMWCDGSSRLSCKFFAGQQRAPKIARSGLEGLHRLWIARRDALTSDPFGIVIGMSGSSFNLDARKAWTGIDAGYSPDEQGHAVVASPVVEILGALGLEHARPAGGRGLERRYRVWRELLPPSLARAVLGGSKIAAETRAFRFTLLEKGKNKAVMFASEENEP